MNDSLQSDLRILLEKYPELKNTSVDFNSEDFLISNMQETNNNKQKETDGAGATLCSLTVPRPDIIKGHSPKVEIRKSAVHGYGVFAKEAIENDELIEEALLLRLGWRNSYLHDPVLNDYVWGDRSCRCNECQTHGNRLYLALGLGSVYNHADNPNTNTDTNFAAGIQTIKAKRRIEADEEVFITYGKKYFLVRDFMKKVTKNKTLDAYLEKTRVAH